MGVQSWRGLVSTSGSMCFRSERSHVAAELALALLSGIAICPVALPPCVNLDSARLRASRVPSGRHSSLCFLGASCLLRPFGLRSELPTAPPHRCFTLVAPVGVPSWPCVASVSASLERAAYCAPLDCGASCLLRPRCVVTCPRWLGPVD